MVIHTIGQSNDVGWIAAPEYTDAGPGVYRWGTHSTWVPYYDAHASYRPVLGKGLYGALSEDIKFCVSSVGGKGTVDSWQFRESPEYTNFMARVVSTGACDHVIYFGGESDYRKDGIGEALDNLFNHLTEDLAQYNSDVKIFGVKPYMFSYPVYAPDRAIVYAEWEAAEQRHANFYIVANAEDAYRGYRTDGHLVKEEMDILGGLMLPNILTTFNIEPPTDEPPLTTEDTMPVVFESISNTVGVCRRKRDDYKSAFSAHIASAAAVLSKIDNLAASYANDQTLTAQEIADADSVLATDLTDLRSSAASILGIV